MSRQADHDRALERLLRALPDEPAGTTAACIDAEQLAAWSDGGLSPTERASVDGHVASCGRCLAVLAALSDTADVGSVLQQGSAPTYDVGLTPRQWRWWRRPTRWLVPVGTAAAAVLIWMVIPARPPAPRFAPPTQVARDETAPSAPVPQRLEERFTNQAREAAPRQTPASPPPATLSKTTEAASLPAELDQRQRQEKSSQEAVALVEEPTAKPTDTAATQRAANTSQEALSDRMASVAAPASPPPASAPAGGATAALRRADAATIDIPSPDLTRRWRIRAGVVERTTTGGSAWIPAQTPNGAIVTTGASPSPNVCWLVGPDGTVLRTTDGTNFLAVNIAGAGTLASVHTTDANRAVVTAADRRTYTTSDGGRSWRAN